MKSGEVSRWELEMSKKMKNQTGAGAKKSFVPVSLFLFPDPVRACLFDQRLKACDSAKCCICQITVEVLQGHNELTLPQSPPQSVRLPLRVDLMSTFCPLICIFIFREQLTDMQFG